MTTIEQPAAGWWLASDGNWYPPELASQTESDANTTDPSLDEWMVREEGRNGRVVIEPKSIVRTFRRTFGKDDVLHIPLRSITSVHHDRRSLGADIVTVTAGHHSYEWKLKNGETFAARLNEAIYE